MNMTIGINTTQPTTRRDWEWTACEACSGIEEPLWGDAVAFLLDEEVQELYNDMRFALNDVFDEVYPDPSPENEEEYFDRHVGWVQWLEEEFWDEDRGNPGVVRLVSDGDRYTLTARDAESGGLRAIHLDAEMSLKQIQEQIGEFLRAQDPCGNVKARCDEGKAI